MKCKVIAVENQKGGTGKSTTVLNLGVGLANSGKRVLLIDADPQGSLSISLGISKPDDLDDTLANVMARIMKDEQFEDDYALIHCEEGVDLMPCNLADKLRYDRVKESVKADLDFLKGKPSERISPEVSRDAR